MRDGPYDVVVEPDREEHIARHGVSVEEVQEVLSANPFVRRAWREHYRLIGQTAAGVFGLVTARDATDRERRAYRENRRR